MPRAKKPAPPNKLPQELYVVVETEFDGSHYLMALDDISKADDGDLVGIYELREVKRKVVNHALIPNEVD